MRAGRRRQRVILIAAVGVLAAAIALALQFTGALQRVDDAAVDTRFTIRGEQGPPDDLVVVGIDEPSFAALGLQWPLPRSVHADAIRLLSRAGAEVIVYDVQFSEQTTPFDGSQAAADAALDEDLALQDAITASKRVVLATTLVFEDGSPGVLFSDERLRTARASVGSANYDVGPTGTFRRVPYEVDGLRHVAVVAAERATGDRVDPGPFGDDGAWIDYAGPAGTMTTVELAALLEGRVPPATFRGRVVVVGATAPRLQDIHATSYGDDPMSGPEITGNAISTVMRGIPLRDSAGWVDALLIIGLAGAAALAGLQRSVLRGLLPSVVLLLAFVVVVQLAFAGGTVLPIAAPVVALVLAALGALAVNYATVERERRRLRTEFARFVPTEVVGDLIEQVGDGSRLGGRRLYSTVMFCDLRGFTARVERLPPEMVIELLNHYLTQMSDAILDHGGTVVSYQGDGIMSVFGAPLERPDHADRAIAAAREMLGERLERVNARVAERGMGEPFTMGVGLCSGPVMSGNVGSDRRLEYAAVGDTTNTAARLQGLTKETGRAVLIADTTRAALTRPVPDLTAVGALDVRGRAVPAAVWTLASPEGQESPAGA